MDNIYNSFVHFSYALNKISFILPGIHIKSRFENWEEFLPGAIFIGWYAVVKLWIYTVIWFPFSWDA